MLLQETTRDRDSDRIEAKAGSFIEKDPTRYLPYSPPLAHLLHLIIAEPCKFTIKILNQNDAYYALVDIVPGMGELYAQTFGQQPVPATGTDMSLGYNMEASFSFFEDVPAYHQAEKVYEGHTVDGATPLNVQPSSWTGPQCATTSAFEHFPHAAAEGYTNWFPSLSYGRDDYYNKMESGIIHPSYQEMMMPPSFLGGTYTQVKFQAPKSSAFGPFAHQDSAYTASDQSFRCPSFLEQDFQHYDRGPGRAELDVRAFHVPAKHGCTQSSGNNQGIWSVMFSFAAQSLAWSIRKEKAQRRDICEKNTMRQTCGFVLWRR